VLDKAPRRLKAKIAALQQNAAGGSLVGQGATVGAAAAEGDQAPATFCVSPSCCFHFPYRSDRR